MDVYGKNPTSEEGRYLRHSVWGWHPLAQYVLTEHPEIAAGCHHWHSNDGDGLDEQGALDLAFAIRADLAAGRAQAYVAERNAWLAGLPREVCRICEGKGTRTRDDDRRLVPEIVGRGEWIAPEVGMKCNGCSGEGSCENPETFYRLGVADLEEFATFLAACGGFEIL